MAKGRKNKKTKKSSKKKSSDQPAAKSAPANAVTGPRKVWFLPPEIRRLIIKALVDDAIATRSADYGPDECASFVLAALKNVSLVCHCLDEETRAIRYGGIVGGLSTGIPGESYVGNPYRLDYFKIVIIRGGLDPTFAEDLENLARAMKRSGGSSNANLRFMIFPDCLVEEKDRITGQLRQRIIERPFAQMMLAIATNDEVGIPPTRSGRQDAKWMRKLIAEVERAWCKIPTKKEIDIRIGSPASGIVVPLQDMFKGFERKRLRQLGHSEEALDKGQSV